MARCGRARTGEKQEAHGQQVVNYEIRRAALRGREKVVAD
jgi:hypothetical protein